MKPKAFIDLFFTPAHTAGNTFNLNPVVILAQAALESGWGQSFLCVQHNNFFGMTGYGDKNRWWQGTTAKLHDGSLAFRTYQRPEDSFMDYGRLLRQVYPRAAEMSAFPKAFAREIAYSRYISEVNGDDREAYRRALVSICSRIEREIDQMINARIAREIKGEVVRDEKRTAGRETNGVIDCDVDDIELADDTFGCEVGREMNDDVDVKVA